MAFALALTACATNPPEGYRQTVWRPTAPASAEISKASIGLYPTHFRAEVASARYASVGGAMIEPVYAGGRRLWRVKVIGRIGESPESLRRRMGSAR